MIQGAKVGINPEFLFRLWQRDNGPETQPLPDSITRKRRKTAIWIGIYNGFGWVASFFVGAKNLSPLCLPGFCRGLKTGNSAKPEAPTGGLLPQRHHPKPGPSCNPRPPPGSSRDCCPIPSPSPKAGREKKKRNAPNPRS
jgi:hypothetical protein